METCKRGISGDIQPCLCFFAKLSEEILVNLKHVAVPVSAQRICNFSKVNLMFIAATACGW